MGFFDNFGETLQQKAEDIGNQVGGFFVNEAGNKILEITTGQPPKGNLSEEEINKGKTGEAPSVYPGMTSGAPMEWLERAGGGVKILGMPVIPVLLVGVLAGFLIFKRR